MEQQQSATERVTRGLAWIKENADLLDLDLSRVNTDPAHFSITDGTACVLAQAGRRAYWRVLGEAQDRGRAPLDDGETGWAEDHGFLPYVGAEDDHSLEEAWRNALTAS